MVPTLLDGDIMILDKIGYRINGLKRFDIVVIKYNNEKIPENKYLVLGDNRSISKDSRIIGLIDKEDIEGYTGIIVFPFKRIGNVIE